MMKVSDNKISSLKSYFFEALTSFPLSDVRNYFDFLCNAWLGLSKTDIVLNPNIEISESELLKFFYGIKDLKNNRPIQYIAGKTWFYDIEINIREGVLIPRPETEELVDWIVNDSISSAKILDIGTGSGCIPLALKNKLKNSEVYGFDISKKALQIANNNAISLGLQAHFSEFNILEWKHLPQENKFDIIASNPPYIPEYDKKMMHENVLNYEPDLALFVPNDNPLIFYKSIADFSFLNLNPLGRLYFEIHELYGEEVIQILKDSGFNNIKLRKDLQGKDRMIRAFKP